MIDGPRSLMAALEYAYVASAKTRQTAYVTGQPNGYSVDITPSADAIASVKAFGPDEPAPGGAG